MKRRNWPCDNLWQEFTKAEFSAAPQAGKEVVCSRRKDALLGPVNKGKERGEFGEGEGLTRTLGAMVRNWCFVPRAVESFKQGSDKHFDNSLLKGNTTYQAHSKEVFQKKVVLLLFPLSGMLFPQTSCGSLARVLQMSTQRSSSQWSLPQTFYLLFQLSLPYHIVSALLCFVSIALVILETS